MTTTRSEHHADSDSNTVRESRRIVRQTLDDHCQGRDNAMTGRELTDLVPIAYTTVRDVIAELRDDPDGPPIGSCGDGYFVIESAAELDQWVRGKHDEIDTIENRIQANVRSFNQQVRGRR